MSDLEARRKETDDFFKSDQDSPIPPEQRNTFQGLKYYPDNPDLRFEVELTLFTEPEKIMIQASKGAVREFFRYGSFQFTVEGQIAKLFVYKQQDQEYLFVPFTDTTTGKDTYGGGRYLELDHLKEDRYLVDFNLAYNPWCAYSPDFSCVIPPQENRLQVPIRAGEKTYPKS